MKDKLIENKKLILLIGDSAVNCIYSYKNISTGRR
jgi:hypothetical protein